MERRSRSRALGWLAIASMAIGSATACSESETATTEPTSAPASTGPATTEPAETTVPTEPTEPTAPETSVPGTLPTEPTSPATSEPTPETLQLDVHLLRGEHVGLVHREVEYTTGTSRAAMAELLAGPTDAEAALGLTSAIPEGTELLDISIADRITTVDLSSEFGSGGGSLSMMARLAQLVYTLTAFDTVDGVVLEIEGERADVFGSEGLVLEFPLDRTDVEDLTPAIYVETPAPFDELGASVRVSGTANVFEAVFLLRISDPSGDVLFEEPVMATSGTGTRGTFDVTVELDVDERGTGTFRVWEPSAMDGSDTNVVEFPVEL